MEFIGVFLKTVALQSLLNWVFWRLHFIQKHLQDLFWALNKNNQPKECFWHQDCLSFQKEQRNWKRLRTEPRTDHLSSRSQRVCPRLKNRHARHANVLLPFEILHFVSWYVAECPPLGMESHKIESDQLLASSVSQYRFSPQRARLNMQVHTFTHIYSHTHTHTLTQLLHNPTQLLFFWQHACSRLKVKRKCARQKVLNKKWSVNSEIVQRRCNQTRRSGCPAFAS